MDKTYWSKVYSEKKSISEPSNFALFLAAQCLEEVGTLIDVGCGDGRDTYFFAETGLRCIGIDQCTTSAINFPPLKNSHHNINFLQEDFTQSLYDTLAPKGFSIYSRFTLHALSYQEEEGFLKNLANSKHLKYLFIETRSINDELYGKGTEIGRHEFLTSHYRRFIDPDSLKSQLNKSFEIKYFEEGKGFAPLPYEDPCLIRAIASPRPTQIF